jgi:hypothetical protein
MHRHSIGHDTDTREVVRSTLTAAVAVRKVGATDHCRQSSHQGLGVVLQRRTYRREGAEAKAITTQWVGERSVGSGGTCAVRCLLLRERAEAKRRGELEPMRNEHGDGGQTHREARWTRDGLRLPHALPDTENLVPLPGIILY